METSMDSKKEALVNKDGKSKTPKSSQNSRPEISPEISTERYAARGAVPLPGAAPASVAEAVPAIASLDKKWNLDDVVVENFVADLIPWFLENRNKEIATLQKAAADGDFETTRHIGHTLKGTSGGYGFIQLGILGGQLEHESREANGAKVKAIIEEMKQHLGRVRIIYAP